MKDTNVTWVTFKECAPPDHTWIKVICEDETTEWIYFVEINDGIVLLSDNPDMEHVFTAGGEGITHWHNLTNK